MNLKVKILLRLVMLTCVGIDVIPAAGGSSGAAGRSVPIRIKRTMPQEQSFFGGSLREDEDPRRNIPVPIFQDPNQFGASFESGEEVRLSPDNPLDNPFENDFPSSPDREMSEHEFPLQRQNATMLTDNTNQFAKSSNVSAPSIAPTKKHSSATKKYMKNPSLQAFEDYDSTFFDKFLQYLNRDAATQGLMVFIMRNPDFKDLLVKKLSDDFEDYIQQLYDWSEKNGILFERVVTDAKNEIFKVFANTLKNKIVGYNLIKYFMTLQHIKVLYENRLLPQYEFFQEAYNAAPAGSMAQKQAQKAIDDLVLLYSSDDANMRRLRNAARIDSYWQAREAIASHMAKFRPKDKDLIDSVNADRQRALDLEAAGLLAKQRMPSTGEPFTPVRFNPVEVTSKPSKAKAKQSRQIQSSW